MLIRPFFPPAANKFAVSVSAIAPNVPTVAVFKTAFHQTMPEKRKEKHRFRNPCRLKKQERLFNCKVALSRFLRDFLKAQFIWHFFDIIKIY
jgi:hypothetical protein